MGFKCTGKIPTSNVSGDFSLMNMIVNRLSQNTKIITSGRVTTFDSTGVTMPALILDANPRRVAWVFNFNFGTNQINAYVMVQGSRLCKMDFTPFQGNYVFSGPNWEPFIPLEWQYDDAGAPINFDVFEFFT